MSYKCTVWQGSCFFLILIHSYIEQQVMVLNVGNMFANKKTNVINLFCLLLKCTLEKYY